MTPGGVSVHGTLASLFLMGGSIQNLWFKADDKEESVIDTGGRCAAHRCTGCGAVIINPHTKAWG
jgi:hypothetical protein